jgi:hypothetical protein
MYSSLMVFSLVAQLAGAAASPPPPAAGTVCAVKYGEKRSYWNEQAALADGAYVLSVGECPWVGGKASGG